MCPPTYYKIKYEINPWMSLNRQADTALANRQWEALYNLLLKKIKIKIEVIEPEPDLPDMVFTANAGLVYGRQFIRSNFRHKEREPEEIHYYKWFEEHGYQVTILQEDSAFEGEGDALWVGDRLFAGYKYRTDKDAHKMLKDILNTEIVSLRLQNPYFYHLDTCFTPINEDTVCYYPQAFDSRSKKVIKESIKNLIAVSSAEAKSFSCNAIVFENTVILNKGAKIMKSELKRLKFTVFELDFSEFIKAGGSAKCMVLWI